jgi:hypothetical protein
MRVAIALKRIPRGSPTGRLPPDPASPGPNAAAASIPMRCAIAAATFLLASAALAGPVLVYREGAYCPRDRPATAPRITAAQAIERASTLLPEGFCGPTWYVSGCDFDPESAFDTWRVYAQQYQLARGEKEYRGRDHSYVVLDAVGNCLANIPGT